MLPIMCTITKEVAPFVETKDLIADGLRLLGMILLKAFSMLVDLLYGSISTILQIDFLGRLYTNYGEEIKMLSWSVLTMAILFYFMIKMMKPNAIKDYVTQILIAFIFISGMATIVSYTQQTITAISDYSVENVNSQTLSEKIIANLVVDVKESVAKERIMYLKDTNKDMDILSLEVNSATNVEPLNRKVRFTLKDGTVVTDTLNKPWWAFGNLDETIYLYNVDFMWGIIFSIVVVVGLLFSFFKFGRMNLLVAWTVLTSPLFVASDLSGTRTKQIIKDVMGLLGSLFLMVFAYKMYADLIALALSKDDIIVRLVYLFVVSEFIITMPQWVQKALRLDVPAMAGQKSMLGAMLMSQAIRGGIKGIKHKFSGGHSSGGETGNQQEDTTNTNDGENATNTDSKDNGGKGMDEPNVARPMPETNAAGHSNSQTTTQSNKEPNVTRPSLNDTLGGNSTSSQSKQPPKPVNPFGGYAQGNIEGTMSQSEEVKPNDSVVIDENSKMDMHDLHNKIDQEYGDFKIGTKYTYSPKPLDPIKDKLSSELGENELLGNDDEQSNKIKNKYD